MLALLSVLGVLYLTIPPTFPGRVASWHFWGWFKALQNLFSGFITEANNNHFCCTCGQLTGWPRVATCGTSSSLPLARCLTGRVSAWLSMEWAWTQPEEERAAHCRSCWEALSGVEVALNLLSGHVNCIFPCHLQGTKAVPGFSEVSFSWPCFVVSPLNPFHISDTHLADHIQAVYTSDYQWLCCPWGRSSIIVNQSPSEGMAAAFYRERWAFLINFCHSGTCKI